MKPLRLSIKGFSSYRTEQVVDFRGLDTFVIKGPTGSGKTSILDAICFALYGWIERVGKETGQFVSQGVARMSVSLDFSVGGRVHRVTRSARRGASAKIQYAALREGFAYEDVIEGEIAAGASNGDAWERPEGSDRVRDANARIIKVLGLNYDSFTRAVLLPQGRFQEFLAGEAKERREILTDLLGLSLFPTMQRAANTRAREAKQQAETLLEVVRSEYADATPEAIAALEAGLVAARDTDQQARATVAAVSEIAARHRDAVASAERARGAAREAQELAAEATEVAEAHAAATASVATATEEISAREAAVADATTALAAAEDALKGFEAAWGGPAEIAGQIARAESLSSLRARITEVEARIAGSGTQLAKAEQTRERAAAEVATHRELVGGLQTRREAALEEFRAAAVGDAIAEACRGLHAGDPCPVCASPLPKDPDPPSKAAAAAEAAGKKIRAELDNAQTALKRLEAQLAAAEKEVASTAAGATAAEAERARILNDIEAALSGLTPSFPDGLPPDPLAELVAARERNASLATVRERADAEMKSAERALSSAREGRAQVTERLEAARSRVGSLRAAAVAVRAREVGCDVAEPPANDVPERAVAVAVWASGVAASCLASAEALMSGEGELLRLAREAAGPLLPTLSGTVNDLTAFLDLLDDVARRASGAVAVAEAALGKAHERAERMAALVAQVEEHAHRADRFSALARELHGNAIVAFLQAEALRLLSLAATEHLAELSDGRYRLEYEDDDFRVIDTWNADEARSVKTLSGGETFLASLALALALSEQVRTLASGQRAPLESLFLDEGFGTLDAQHLEEVIAAIDRLGGDGRLVGIITHIPELAERMPARFTVHKTQAGSTVTGPQT